MLKKLTPFIIFVFILFSLSSCTSVVGKSPKGYRNDMTAEETVNRITLAVPSANGYKTVDKDYISRANFGDGYEILSQTLSDWCIVTSARPETNADIIGVFHVRESSQAELVEEIIESYVDAQKIRMSSLYSAYAPDEVPKIQNAEVERCGNYILLTFLDGGRDDIAEEEFEDILKL